MLSGGVGSTGGHRPISRWSCHCNLSILYGLVCVDYLLCEKERKAVYKGENLFLLRQFAFKLKTMRFTMGILTSLFTIFTYRIYTDGTNEVNTWLYTHLKYFGTIYKNEDGTPNEKRSEREMISLIVIPIRL